MMQKIGINYPIYIDPHFTPENEFSAVFVDPSAADYEVIDYRANGFIT